MKLNVYQLYHNKKEATLKVSPIKKIFYKTYADKALADKPQDYIYYHNENYFFSLSRKALVQKAREMKEECIKEMEVKLDMYKSIKI
jgi:hypothetical protein